MANVALPLSPEELEASQVNVSFFREVFERTDETSPFFGCVAESDKRWQAFVAPSPEAALQWICKRVHKRKLLQVVATMYCAETNAQAEDQERTEDEERGPVQLEDMHANVDNRQEPGVAQANPGESRPAKRQKKSGVKTVQPEADEEGLRYRSFIDKLPVVSRDTKISMVAKAASIATSDCLREWKVVLRMWRARSNSGKPFSPDSTVRLGHAGDGADSLAIASQDSLPSTLPSTQLTITQDKDAVQHGFSLSDTRSFRNLFLAAQKSNAAGIVGDMKHRWIMSAMYSKYDELEEQLRQSTTSAGGRGRGFATVAREQLFSLVYEENDGTPATRQSCAAEWTEFGHWLDYGKRWSMLGRKFGLGIFALLPRGVTNSYVERTLSIARFTDWIDMIAECNMNVSSMASAVEKLYIACMTDKAPPPVLRLECLDDDELRHCDPVSALWALDDWERGFQEVPDDE